MLTKSYDIVLKLGREDIITAQAIVVQNDAEVYTLNIRIFDGYTEIDYAQVPSATLTFALANRTVVQNDPDRLTLSAAGIAYEMGTDEIAYPGTVIASVQLLGASGERLTTARFKFTVISDLITPESVQSDSNYPLLQKMLLDVAQLKSDIVNLQVPNNSLLDLKLSDAAGQIKDKVTTLQSNVETHKAENAAHAELTDRTITVGAGKDFTTIQAAINSIKKHVLANIYVNVDPGTYNEVIIIKGFYGGGSIYINGASLLADTHNVQGLSVQNCNLKVHVTGFKAIYPNCFDARYSSFVQYSFCKTDVVVGGGAVSFESSTGIVTNCLISNRYVALYITRNSHVISSGNSGTGNTIVLNAISGSVIAKEATQPEGTTAESAGSGGVIR